MHAGARSDLIVAWAKFRCDAQRFGKPTVSMCQIAFMADLACKKFDRQVLIANSERDRKSELHCQALDRTLKGPPDLSWPGLSRPSTMFRDNVDGWHIAGHDDCA